jgi:DNA-binding transcriptional regulator YiaG
MKKTKKNGRGGRKPGTWSLVTPESILAHRKEHKLSRGKFAKALGVSPTTIQNWEMRRAVATPKAQARLAEIMSLRADRPAPTTTNESTNGHRTRGYDSTVEATGRIVAALLATAKIPRKELAAVILEVKSALD